MLQQAQYDQAETLQGQYTQALAEQKAALVHEAEEALINENVKKRQLTAEYMRTLSQTQNAAEENMQQAQNTIHGVRRSFHVQEQSHASLQRRMQEMQNAMDSQRHQMNMEFNSIQKKYDEQVQQIQAQQAQSAQKKSTRKSGARTSM